MTFRARALFAIALVALLIPAIASAQLSPYAQSFGTLDAASPSALGDDGWLVFANVFAPDGVTYLYGYGVFPAPNGSGGFCNVAVGEGGAMQGSQQLVVFNDYNNADHNVGNRIEANVFQEFTIAPGNVGEFWQFDFQAKKGDIAGASTAFAFIKTLDPGAGFATTNFIPIDMTSISDTWGDYSLSIAIDASLSGQLLQIGFASVASNFEPSGIFYDNINFNKDGVITVEDESWGSLKGKFRQ